MLEVAEHYYHFGGVSPINQRNRELIEALRAEMAEHGPKLPIYWGNRNWHPLLTDTVHQMQKDGVRRALALVTSAFGSYSGCRQYLEDIERARAEVGPNAPQIDKLRTFYNHPGFIQAMSDRVSDAFARIPEARRADAKLLFTAHSIPMSMAATSPYVAQLEESCQLAGKAVRRDWRLVYQSRSGPPGQPWLEPDVGAAIREMHATGGLHAVVLAPIGFLSDHMEVVYDLDTEVAALCRELGVNFSRAGTVGTPPAFVSAIRDLIVERMEGRDSAVCHPECCAPPRRPAPR
jgi:protoporphyrin/coproporphyrin ferrochelatase